MKKYYCFFLLLLVSTSHAQLRPGEFVQYTDSVQREIAKDMIEYLPEYYSYINWSEGVLVTDFSVPITYNDRNVGRNHLNLSDKLKERILQYMLGAINKIRVSSVFTLGDIFDRSQHTRLHVMSIIYDRPLENAITINSQMQGQISLPLFGKNSVTSLLYQNILSHSVTNYLQRETIATQTYDTLIIDMIMFPNFRASLTPRILSPKGEVIHSIETVNQDILQKQSAVHYVTSITEALNHPSTGEKISYILPSSIDGALLSDIVLFEEDVNDLFSQQRTIDNLKKGKVIIIMPNK